MRHSANLREGVGNRDSDLNKYLKANRAHFTSVSTLLRAQR